MSGGKKNGASAVENDADIVLDSDDDEEVQQVVGEKVTQDDDDDIIIEEPEESALVVPSGPKNDSKPSENQPESKSRRLPELRKGDRVYGLERGLKDPWREARIVNMERHFGKAVVKLKFVPGERVRSRRKVIDERVVQCKHLAYFEPDPEVIPVGFRVIGRTMDRSSELCNFFYAGVVAEPPKPTNRFRYLIFFDDGFAAYCERGEVRMTWYNGAAANTWAEVHPDNQKFIKHYIRNYPQNNMAKLKESQITIVEWNGLWWTARVRNVDCSMVKLELIANRIVFDIWRGSCRLLSLYKQNKVFKQLPPPKKTNEEYEGRVVQHTIPKKYMKKQREHRPHPCNKKCVSWLSKEEQEELPKLSPLLVPFYHGWTRGIEPNDPQRRIYYRAPCGVKMWDLDKIQAFISKCETRYSIDCFCFDFELNCFDEFEVSLTPNFAIKDISGGLEKVPISQINCVDELPPEPITYTNRRILGKGVSINVDPDFMVCCDCVDDCQDRTKCACYRLTFDSEPENVDVPGPLFKGYQHRRLYEKYMLGIYECNKRCKCSANCTNRVVQQGLKWRLQVFKTTSKGYAIRTLQDIPLGSFICVYTGNLLSSREANESGAMFGDEYLANVDFIEAAETHKDGYEAVVVEPEPEPVKKGAKGKTNGKKSKNGSTKKGKKGDDKPKNGKGAKDSCNFGGKRKRIIEETEDSEDEDLVNSNSSKTRTLYGDKEDCEIFAIDAKKIGNIGRYLNHSCDPNVFAQDVFLDTHDIRFPWVAFFASRHIKCGTELTWDYNYEVGMAEGKSMACNCGSMYCRRRLL